MRFSLPMQGDLQIGGPPIVLNISTQERTQLVFRYDTLNNVYTIRRCAYQNFNKWQGASTHYFDECLSLGNITVITNTFDTWYSNKTYVTLKGQDLEDFETWTNNPDWYVTREGQGTVGWYVEQAKIIDEIAPASPWTNACRLRNGEDLGKVWPNRSTLTDGLKTFSFDYRATWPDHYHTWYTNSTGWTNYIVSADITVTNVSPEWPYVSVYARYLDDAQTNAYEARLVRTNTTQLVLQIRREGAPTNMAETTKFTAPIIGTHRLQCSAVTNNNGYVFVEARCRGIDPPYDEKYTWAFDSTSAKIDGPGTVGLRTHDADVAMDNVTVRGRDAQVFSYWTGAPYWGTYSNADWVVYRGGVTNNGGQGTWWCILRNDTAAYLQPPKLAYDPGELYFETQTNGSGNAAWRVRASTNGIDWTIVTNATFAESGGAWHACVVTNGLAGNNYAYIRIENRSSSYNLPLDNVYVTGSTNMYADDFSSGLASGWKTASETHWSDWHVADSNTYNRAGYVGPPVWFDVQTGATNGGTVYEPLSWQTIDTLAVSNLSKDPIYIFQFDGPNIQQE